jgi:hypothetical protein
MGLQARFSLKYTMLATSRSTSSASSPYRQLRNISIQPGIDIGGKTVTVTVASQLPALPASNGAVRIYTAASPAMMCITFTSGPASRMVTLEQ